MISVRVKRTSTLIKSLSIMLLSGNVCFAAVEFDCNSDVPSDWGAYCYNTASGGHPSSSTSNYTSAAISPTVGDYTLATDQTVLLKMNCSTGYIAANWGVYKKGGSIDCTDDGGCVDDQYCQLSCTNYGPQGIVNINSYECQPNS